MPLVVAGELAFCLAEMAAEIGPLLEIVVRKGNGADNRERVRKLKVEAGMFLLVGLGAVYESAGGSVDHLLSGAPRRLTGRVATLPVGSHEMEPDLRPLGRSRVLHGAHR